jgi:hypothetical protein
MRVADMHSAIRRQLEVFLRSLVPLKCERTGLDPCELCERDDIA